MTHCHIGLRQNDMAPIQFGPSRYSVYARNRYFKNSMISDFVQNEGKVDFLCSSVNFGGRAVAD